MKKKFVLILSLTLSIFCVKPADAQSKEEQKEWAKKMKSLKPMDYKKLVEEHEELTTKVSESESAKATLQSELDTKNAEIEHLKMELENAQKANSAPQTSSASSATGLNNAKSPAKGVVYKVQIGTFRNKDLSKYFDNNPNFSGDVDADGTKKYTLGSFTDYWEADRFKKYLREMGVKDAWIVAYKDGRRVDIKDVLEGAL